MHVTKGQNESNGLVSQWLEAIERGDDTWLADIYQENHEKFVSWASRKYDIALEDLEDVYQQAVISMYENVKYHKISALASSPSTYLFGIGKNLLLKRVRTQQRRDAHEVRIQEHWSFLQLDQQEVNSMFEYVQTALSRMKDPCKSIIELFYMHGASIAHITQQLDYKSHDVVKTQKSRCMKALRDSINKNTDE